MKPENKITKKSWFDRRIPKWAKVLITIACILLVGVIYSDAVLHDDLTNLMPRRGGDRGMFKFYLIMGILLIPILRGQDNIDRTNRKRKML